MCSPTQPTLAAGNVVDQLKRAGSAEEFFTLLGVCFDPKVLDVARLHILKRMGQYLASEDLDGVPNSVVAARCKAVLERAYEDFLTSTPLDQRVFKVLKDAVAPKKSHFVPLETLK
ncbi:nitrogenase-stabilizing/protective protein [Rhodopseudomonas rhenobacensis]|uniref:Nitrogenase-stabilizing/protective protein NifW n=1 Tax=Rhodopseudomonas rhenobacensis TaxID=87461 RepID=A0A7W7Z4V0_9BRAD|nr:nitrogenase stabilizing/protective protein NifW [Rhodopseudomonas rhenobacensis]MBB5048009.1 nitrogenase-stabilizing/protective protein [Rhodopseudomonas rhenobacensis]